MLGKILSGTGLIIVALVIIVILAAISSLVTILAINQLLFGHFSFFTSPLGTDGWDIAAMWLFWAAFFANRLGK